MAPSSRSAIPSSGRTPLGLAVTGGRVDRRSIGIELASEGWLEERDGELPAFGRPFGGAVYDLGVPWREHRYFAAYTPE